MSRPMLHGMTGTAALNRIYQRYTTKRHGTTSLPYLSTLPRQTTLTKDVLNARGVTILKASTDMTPHHPARLNIRLP